MDVAWETSVAVRTSLATRAADGNRDGNRRGRDQVGEPLDGAIDHVTQPWRLAVGTTGRLVLALAGLLAWIAHRALAAVAPRDA